MSVYLDCEFFNTSEEQVTPVCIAIMNTKTGEFLKFWTLDDEIAQQSARNYILKNIDEIFCGYAVIAEGRFFLSLGLDPVKFKWKDLFLEYRCITNHNDRMMFGPQLVNGKVVQSKRPPPKWERTEEENYGSFKPTHSLAEATFKLTGQIRDTEHKDKMRDIIISGDRYLINLHKTDILEYCVDDTKFLPELYKGIMDEYKDLLEGEDEELKSLPKEMLLRGKYAALTARMESFGYPINVEKTRNFSNAVGSILDECQREINSLFPKIKPFRWSKKDGKFTWDQRKTREWIEANCKASKWTKTDGGALSLSLDAWSKVFDFKHDYPKDNFGAQMVRYLKLKQNLNGFSPSPKKKTFWDSVGSDGRVRPYFNIYGAQSSRSQPAATGFLFLKPAWMRALCEPKPGKAIASFDYGSQEFLISALVSEDKNMLWAYQSGDVYLAFGQLAGAIPKNGTKDTHKKERNLFKSTTLGVSYLMTKFGLAAKLSADTGEVVSEDKAQELIDLFLSSYPEFAAWQKKAIDDYTKRKKKIKLPCGWILWPDNDNHRSAANAPIQGFGACIMRKAVEFCYEEGLNVILTLHDALYIEYDSGDYAAIDKLHDCMKRAFVFYFENKKNASSIRLDGFTWSPDYPAPKILINDKGKEYEEYDCITTPKGLEIERSNIYIDERAGEEYKQFSRYFEADGSDFL